MGLPRMQGSAGLDHMGADWTSPSTEVNTHTHRLAATHAHTHKQAQAGLQLHSRPLHLPALQPEPWAGPQTPPCGI